MEQVKNIYTKNKIRTILVFLFAVVTMVIALLGVYIFSPVMIDGEKIVTIPEGYSIIQTGNLLEEQGLIKSPLVFRALAQIDNVVIKAGSYLFGDSVSLTQVLVRLQSADYGDVYISVTLPEGLTIREMSDILSENLSGFDPSVFTELTKGKEGYLFPDTYQFLPEIKTAVVVDTLLANFEERTRELQSQNTNRTWGDIVIMASLIEKEATGNEREKKMVSGILWKRLDEGKLLQVDAPFKYIHGEVRAADLRKDGPYNTYTRQGLTPTPIGNPGLSALDASMYPETSSYYFYLHGRDGTIRYANTYNQHLNNINRYLR